MIGINRNDCSRSIGTADRDGPERALPDTVIVSDDAGQFRVGIHAPCWVHAERLVHKLVPANDRRKYMRGTVRPTHRGAHMIGTDKLKVNHISARRGTTLLKNQYPKQAKSIAYAPQPGWILTRSATPSIALLHRQIHRQKSVPVSNPQLPPDFEGKQSAWQKEYRAGSMRSGGALRVRIQAAPNCRRSVTLCPRQNCRTAVTFDNDSAFAQHARLKTMCAMTTWFCDAYASWQKGGVENANGRLRRWLPRQIDIDKVSDEEIQDIILTANLTPRK